MDQDSPLELVCVPGLGLQPEEWGAAARAVADGAGARRVSLLSLPGYGARPGRADRLSPRALGAGLAAGLGGRTVLMGHSASCQVVAHAAALAPDRVGALVLVGPTTDPRAATWPRLATRWLRTAVRERPGQVPFLARSYARTGPVWMARAMAAARGEDVRGDLRDVRCPVLVLRGPHDVICPDDWARALAGDGPPGSRAVTLDGGAHMVPLTHAEAVAAAVTAWLAGAGVRGR